MVWGVSMNDTQVHVWIDKEDIEIWNKIRLFCLKKHGKLHSKIGKELMQFARIGFENSTETHTPQNTRNSKNKGVASLFNKLLNHTKIDDDNFIFENKLKEYVGDAIGFDSRTYRKYRDMLVLKKIISPKNIIMFTKKARYEINTPKLKYQLKRLSND